MKCDRKGCKSNDAIMAYLDEGNDTYLMQLCFEHIKELKQSGCIEEND